MDLPFNGVGLTKQKQAGSASYPPSPATSELPGCLGCCGKQDKEAQQVHTAHAQTGTSRYYEGDIDNV